MTLTLAQAKAAIDSAFARYASTAPVVSVVPASMTAGKVYEAWVLAMLLEGLHLQEGYNVTLVGSKKVVLKSSPGPINRAYAHFKLSRVGSPGLEVWTDIEFMSLSYHMRGAGIANPPDYHELDVVVVAAGAIGRPRHDAVLLGVECKHTTFGKALARGAAGIRRELSLVTQSRRTTFRQWPRTDVPANPPSVLLVCSSDPGISAYGPAGAPFGIDYWYVPM